LEDEMRSPTKVQLLAEVPLFANCTKKELSRIASLADRVRVEAGRVLTEEGKPGKEFFVVEEGSARVTVRGKKRATLGPGDFFGEMALLDQGPRSATVASEGPMSLYVIGQREFIRLLDEVPFVARRVLTGMAKRLRSLENAPAAAWDRLW
jgi:CRP/FNR family cyclic AMP-dependent transcriptional regulator